MTSPRTCQAQTDDCTYRAVHRHHVKLRSRGGTNDPSNLIDVCVECHNWIHAHPAAATEKGLMKPSWEDEG